MNLKKKNLNPENIFRPFSSLNHTETQTLTMLSEMWKTSSHTSLKRGQSVNYCIYNCCLYYTKFVQRIKYRKYKVNSPNTRSNERITPYNKTITERSFEKEGKNRI